MLLSNQICLCSGSCDDGRTKSKILSYFDQWFDAECCWICWQYFLWQRHWCFTSLRERRISVTGRYRLIITNMVSLDHAMLLSCAVGSRAKPKTWRPQGREGPKLLKRYQESGRSLSFLPVVLLELWQALEGLEVNCLLLFCFWRGKQSWPMD